MNENTIRMSTKTYGAGSARERGGGEGGRSPRVLRAAVVAGFLVAVLAVGLGVAFMQGARVPEPSVLVPILVVDGLAMVGAVAIMVRLWRMDRPVR